MGSLSAAARECNAPVSQVTRSLVRLEAACGVSGHTRTDNSALHLSLVLNRVGTAQLNDLMVQPLVPAGRLLPLLLQEQFASERIPIYAVTPQARQRLPRIRACIDYWADCLARMNGAPGGPAGLPSR